MEFSCWVRESWNCHFSQRTREMGHPAYGLTVIVAVLLTIFPIVAVMSTVPPVVIPGTCETTPADTVARFVLLEVQVATVVTSKEPLQVAACANNVRVGLLPDTDPLVCDNAMD
jgi:cytosine/uracil/thiamine/allantoin permease